jgi:hypothetical protein
MIVVLRAVFLVALVAIAVLLVVAPRVAQRPLDPDQATAADGSMTAGRMRTIYDTSPILRSAAEAPRSDPDDPQDFEQRLTIEQPNDDHARNAMAEVLGPVDGSLCESAAHRRLMTAVHNYYDTRGRQKHSFDLRGPRASAAIEKVWSTPVDRQIDEFVRRTVLSGFLHKNEVLAAYYLPEFAKTFAATDEVGAECPPTKVQQRADGFLHTVPEESVTDRAEPVLRPPKTGDPD